MNIKTDNINATRKALVVNIEADEIEKEHESLLNEFAKKANLPGFRPGRAPRNLVSQRFAKELKSELTQKVISSAYRKALEETKVEVFNLIDLKGGEIERGRENELSFVVDVHPEFNLPEYKGIPMDKPDTEVTDEEVEKTLETLRSQRADFNVVERAAKSGDYIKLSYEGKIEGKPIAEILPDHPIYGKQAATWEEAGSSEGGIPGFAEQLVGLKAGDKKDLEVAFPEDFNESGLAGKQAVYSVEIQEVRERVLPEIDEAFLKELNVESLDRLKDQIRQDLARRKENDGRARSREQVGNTLLSRIEFEVPETAVESETESILRQLVDHHMRRGGHEEDLEKNKEALYERARKTAEPRVKLRMILLKVAEAENIKVEDKDVQNFLMHEAMNTGQRPEQIVKELRKDERRAQAIQQAILFDKALDFLVEQATLSEATT